MPERQRPPSQSRYSSHRASRSPNPPVVVAIGLVVLVPIAFDPGGYFIFLPIKLLIAMSLVPLGVAALIWRGENLPLSGSHIMWLAFLLVLIAASLLGLGGITSWLGSPNRGLGIFAWTMFAGAFWLGSSIRERSDLRGVLLAAAATSIPVSAYALLQATGVDFIEWAEGIDTSRARSTVGNAAFLGAYLAMIVPVSGRLCLDSSESRGGRVLFAVAGLGGTAALLSTQTRAAWVGVIVGGLLVALLDFKKLREAPLLSAISIGAVVAILIVVATVSPLAPRLRSIVDPATGTGRGRVIQWERTVDLIAARPVLGWGPETYSFVFPQFIDEEFERTVGREVIPDRAHNVFLDVASAAGIVGALVYAGIVALIAWTVLRAPRGEALRNALAGGCVAYFIQLQFSFPLADLDAIFWLFSGLLIAPFALQPVRIRRFWAALLIVAAAGLAIWDSTHLYADRKLRGALEAESAGGLARAQTLVDDSASVPRVEYLQAAARLHRRIGESTGSSDAFIRGLSAVDRARGIAPNDSELALDRADLLLSWGQASRRRDLILRAVEGFKNILVDDRSSSRVHLKLGVGYAELGSFEEAERAWLASADLSPRSVGPLMNLELLYEQTGRIEEAKRMRERVERLSR